MKTKHIFQFLSYFIIGVFVSLSLSCDEETVEPNNNPPPPPPGPITANEITEDFLFDNIKILQGAIPTPSGGVDLKIDTDTIFWVEGIVKPIKILKPLNLGSGVISFYAQVEGSDNYIEADLEQDQETDTVAFLNFEFDPSSWGLPLVFDLKIVPKDESGTPLDEFDLPVVIEEARSGCGNLDNTLWEWIYTTMDGDYSTGPMDIVQVAGTTGGCCDGNGNEYLPCTGSDPNFTEMDYEITNTVGLDYFKLFSGGDLGGQLQQVSVNLDRANSDVCANQASYTSDEILNTFTGTYNMINSCSFTINDLVGQSEPVYSNGVYLGDIQLPIYVGSGQFVEYEILSAHFIKEIRNVEGGQVERMYERRDFLSFLSDKWFD